MSKDLKMNLRLGSRGSPLALVQANFVAAAIQKKFPDVTVNIVTIQTSGDKFKGERLADAGGKALFVKEIEEALLKETIDFAVHSLKDLPGDIPEELTLAAFPKREDSRDCFVSLQFKSFDALPKGSVVGTTSPRREVQIATLRPDLQVKPIRGNIDTRLKKMEAGSYDAIILAVAGLKRLGKQEIIRQYFDPSFFIPAVGQGILGIETKKNRSDLIRCLREALNDLETEFAGKAERAFLKTMGGDCFTPLGAYARVEGGNVKLLGWLGNPDGTKNIRMEKRAPVDQVKKLGVSMAQDILERGGKEILDAIASHPRA
ncbi:MAG: hydroxymethylbilane synthase [Deltaproteobacteria bacterium RIFCSPLOWO2_02_FULL_46_8]|nr:MAG: hydroxymethylbilane synthase [Deltaproteobacteria bacterium RIFCSPLOWO2_02_FULL_46_8]